MLFKLISNGHTTQVEMDGQRLCEGLRAVTFTHRKGAGDNDCRVCLEFDLTARTAREAVDRHVFGPARPGDFQKHVALMERMYEVPESRGKEPQETQTMIDRMKEAEACEVSAMVERLAMGRLRERAQAARDTRERMEYELLSRIIETRSALDQIGEIVDEAGDTWCYVVALKTYAAECGGHGLPRILLDRARAGLDRFIVYRKRVNETLVLSENEKKVCTENIVKAVLSGI